ncbi:MAG: hypothetical protein ISS23_01205 [Nanoarchaeota archaeon]|nr:hypothetical protein [Nanoarchaeota archaeon]
MKRKDLAHLAIDLIEEALEKPYQIIVVQERITKPTSEPGVKEPTEEELEQTRDYVMEVIEELNNTSIYLSKISYYTSFLPVEGIVYNNNSKILRRKTK